MRSRSRRWSSDSRPGSRRPFRPARGARRRSVFSKPEMSLNEAPGGEGRLGNYRVSVESGRDHHRGEAEGGPTGAPDSVVGCDRQHPIWGPCQQWAGRAGRAGGGPRGGRPAGRPPVSWLIHSPGSGRHAQLPEERVALRIEPSRRLQVRQRPLLHIDATCDKGKGGTFRCLDGCPEAWSRTPACPAGRESAGRPGRGPACASRTARTGSPSPFRRAVRPRWPAMPSCCRGRPCRVSSARSVSPRPRGRAPRSIPPKRGPGGGGKPSPSASSRSRSRGRGPVPTKA